MAALACSRPRFSTSTGCKLQLSSFVLAITVTSCLGFHRFGPMGLEKNTKHKFHDFHSVFAQPANNVESMINLREHHKPTKLGFGFNPNENANNAKVENVFSEFGEQKKFKRMGLDNFNYDEFPQLSNKKSTQFQQPENTVNIAEEPNQEENAIVNQHGIEPQGRNLKESDSVNQGKVELPKNNQENGPDFSLLEQMGSPSGQLSSLNVLFHTLDTLRPETNKMEPSFKAAANVPKQELLQVFEKVPNNAFVNELTQQTVSSKSLNNENFIDEAEDTYNKQDIKNSPTTSVRKILFPRNKKRTSITYQGKIVPIKHVSPSFPKLYHTHNLPLSRYGLDDAAPFSKPISNPYNAVPDMHYTGSHLIKTLNAVEENMGLGEKLESTKYFDEFSKLGQNNGQNLQNQITNVLGNIKSMVMGAQNEAEGNSVNKNFAEINNLEEIQNAV